MLSYCTEPLLHINDTLFARDDHRMNLVGVSGRARPRHNLEKDLECPKGNPTKSLRLESYDSSDDIWYVAKCCQDERSS